MHWHLKAFYNNKKTKKKKNKTNKTKKKQQKNEQVSHTKNRAKSLTLCFLLSLINLAIAINA